MSIQTLADASVEGKIVVMRVDFNVPLKDGVIQESTRITATLPTIQKLQEMGAKKIVLLSHLGRPKGERKEELSLKPISIELSNQLDQPVKFVNDCIGDTVKNEINNSDENIILLENVRFHSSEKDNDESFSKQLAELGDVYVNDAFAVSHRAHASTVGITKNLPSYAGLLLQAEVDAMGGIFRNAKKPICIVVGGAKIDTKIGILQKFIDIADYILVGGALANTFIAARGFNIAESKYEEDKVELAQEIMLSAEQKGDIFSIPRDVIAVSEISETAEKIDIPVEDVVGDMKIVDIGSVCAKRYAEIIEKSGTIIWNGPLGIHEMSNFSQGSKVVADAIKDSDGVTIVGGGDTLDFLTRNNYDFSKFDHVSTGGGAMIEFLEGKELPGIAALQ